MPDLKTYKLPQICGLFDEAIRTIPGYDKYDPTYEPKALIDYEKTKDNYAIYINPCMRHEKKVRSHEAKSAKIRDFIKAKTGKEARKDAVACSMIVTLPRDYKGDPKEFFENTCDSLCIIMGIKKEDILYACVHMDETQPHLHFAFLPMAYVKDYESKLKNYDAAKAKAKAAGTKVPSRPSSLKGDINRKIEVDEKPITMNCGRFGKGFLHYLNKTLESRLNDAGIEANIATGRGSQFDPQLLHKKQREESLELYEKIKMAEAAQEAAEAKVAALEEEATKATEELNNINGELAKANDELTIAIAQIEECEQDKEELIKEIREIKSEFREFFANIKDMVKKVIKNAINEFINAWTKASAFEKEKVASQAKNFVSDSVEESVNELKAKASKILGTSERYEYNKNLFIQTPQRIGYAIGRVKEAAKGTPYEEEFSMLTKENYESNPRMKFCIDDWFNEEKYKEILERIPSEEQKAYMDSKDRAARAIKALETMEELGIDIEEGRELG